MPTRRQVSALISVPVLIWSQHGLASEGASSGRGGQAGTSARSMHKIGSKMLKP